ncbi:MAG: glycosyltransferase, partial [Bacteroidota bacterium]
FEEQYGTRFDIVRNATVLQELPERAPQGPYILYQGAVNVGRGLEALIRAMPNIDCPLYICGKGDIYDDLQALCRELGLTDKVTFWGYVEPEALRAYTLNATIGITLFAGGGRSNQHSLANRFFDYMHAGVPQLAMRYPEYTRFNQEFEVARLVDDLTPEAITEAVLELLNDPEYYGRLRQQSLAARERYNWQEEEKTLLSVYARIP